MAKFFMDGLDRLRKAATIRETSASTFSSANAVAAAHIAGWLAPVVVWDWNARVGTDYRKMSSDYGIREVDKIILPPKK